MLYNYIFRINEYDRKHSNIHNHDTKLTDNENYENYDDNYQRK